MNVLYWPRIRLEPFYGALFVALKTAIVDIQTVLKITNDIS